MKKPDSLRDLLLYLVPGLKEDPGRLSVFVDKGQILSLAGRSLSFEYRYTANVVVQDYAGDDNALFVPVLAWIAQHQPDLLKRRDSDPFTFEAELLETGAKDVSLQLDLSERVRVVARDAGGFEVTYLDRPMPLDDGDHFEGVCGVVLREGLAGPELVAP
ncbi:phage tail protein [Sphingomonas jatrophae]|uniref:P2 phage tail completion protein R (GpR) n=1 Tax=Sphingomonas jatrophae TaxID=1166337 RepID=A0A1I6JMK9_9SPHN|nr:phage tail protein [Sphingomonas jatrophae]SFR79800.1 P2 phage tail completion protein R (GpR) [Sphingomonas jatrophae]